MDSRTKKSWSMGEGEKFTMREEITSTEISMAMGESQDWLWERLKEKGKKSFSSTHELRGLMDEEIDELYEALHIGKENEIAHELKDIFVVAVFGLACLRAGKLE